MALVSVCASRQNQLSSLSAVSLGCRPDADQPTAAGVEDEGGASSSQQNRGIRGVDEDGERGDEIEEIDLLSDDEDNSLSCWAWSIFPQISVLSDEPSMTVREGTMKFCSAGLYDNFTFVWCAVSVYVLYILQFTSVLSMLLI